MKWIQSILITCCRLHHICLETNNHYLPISPSMKNGLDFIKVGNYAVININNMFPVLEKCYTYVDFSRERNQQYKKLLIKEYRIILGLQDKIKKMQHNYINKKFRMEIKPH